MGWISAFTSDEVVDKDIALRKERPIIPIDKAPNRLYHRTTHDAAISILEDAMIPGHGGSGKAHCFLSGAALEDQKVKSGVRANLPVDIVFDTKQMLEAG